jgi:hypothetical protein
MAVNRQPWDDDLKAQAKALYLADGATLASEVTGIPVRTIRRWAMADDWGRPPTTATGQDPDQELADLAPGPVQLAGEGKGGHALGGHGPPGLELERDLALARQVYRTEVERFLAGKGRAGGVRDASIALGVMLDKAAKHGLPGARPGGEFTWQTNAARAEAATARILEMAGELAHRARVAGNGHRHG